MIKTDFGLISAVYAGLFAFGFVYNLAIAWLERNGYDEGYTSIMVVVGTLVTLAGVAVIDWRGALVAIGAFAASGFWMVVGSWWRHVRARQASQKAWRGK